MTHRERERAYTSASIVTGCGGSDTHLCGRLPSPVASGWRLTAHGGGRAAGCRSTRACPSVRPRPGARITGETEWIQYKSLADSARPVTSQQRQQQRRGATTGIRRRAAGQRRASGAHLPASGRARTDPGVFGMVGLVSASACRWRWCGGEAGHRLAAAAPLPPSGSPSDGRRSLLTPGQRRRIRSRVSLHRHGHGHGHAYAQNRWPSRADTSGQADRHRGRRVGPAHAATPRRQVNQYSGAAGVETVAGRAPG